MPQSNDKHLHWTPTICQAFSWGLRVQTEQRRKGRGQNVDGCQFCICHLRAFTLFTWETVYSVYLSYLCAGGGKAHGLHCKVPHVVGVHAAFRISTLLRQSLWFLPLHCTPWASWPWSFCESPLSLSRLAVEALRWQPHINTSDFTFSNMSSGTKLWLAGLCQANKGLDQRLSG